MTDPIFNIASAANFHSKTNLCGLGHACGVHDRGVPRFSGLMAQRALDEPENAANFEPWVECIAPTLSKGEIVVMDNLSNINDPRVGQLIKAPGTKIAERSIAAVIERSTNLRRYVQTH
jgi:hypothetical protein